MSVPELGVARTEARPGLRLARLWWAIGWGMVVYITISCLEPPRYVPDLHLWDKLEHALAFGGMTFWFGGLGRPARYPLIAILMLLFGGGIEIAQGAMGLGRDEDIMDFVADSRWSVGRVDCTLSRSWSMATLGRAAHLAYP